jgi:hypothetical protein
MDLLRRLGVAGRERIDLLKVGRGGLREPLRDVLALPAPIPLRPPTSRLLPDGTDLVGWRHQL